MQEVFYEESAKLTNPKTCARNYYIFKALAILMLVVLFIYVLVFWKTTEIYFFTGNGILLRVIIYIALPIASMVSLSILFFKLKDKQYVEYDYSFVSGTIRVSKVIKNFKRRFMFQFFTRDIMALGKFNSDNYIKISKTPNVKIEILTKNKQLAEDKDLYYIYVNCAGKNRLLVFECTKIFIINVIKFTNKLVVEKGL